MAVATLIDTVKSQAWIGVIVLLVIAVFRDLLKNALTAAFSAAGGFAYRRLAGNRLLRRRALRKYQKGLLASSERIPVPFRPDRPLTLSEIYVSLRVASKEGETSTDVWELLAHYPQLVVTGPPGAGKSMLLRHLASSHVHANRVGSGRGRLPVLLELHRLVREAGQGSSIEDHLVDAFDRFGFPRADKFVRIALEKGWLVLLLDGLDEVPASDRTAVAQRMGDFLARHESCPAIVTCRSAVYRGEFDAIADRRVELQPLEDQQIQAFLDSWAEPMPAGKSPGQLMTALREQPKLLGAARNPLLLTIITHLYSDRPTYALPRSRADFYRQAAEILLDQWQGHLGQNKFESPEKRTVLCGLALAMQEKSRETDQDRKTISREDAVACATLAMPGLGLGEDQVNAIVKEIVERSGLLLAIDGGVRYAFAHLTFQEYFAAEALQNRPNLLFEKYSTDPDGWREVVILWCGLAADCTQLVSDVRSVDPGASLACVAEARSIDQGVARAILDPVLTQVTKGAADEATQRSLGAVAADVRPRGDAVLRALVSELEVATTSASRLSIGVALAASNRLPAAEAIVQSLLEEPGLAESVVRLGDLAVPSLLALGHAGGVEPLICECLANTGTPRSAHALATIMLEEGELEIPAAWGLAHVAANPGVEAALARVDLSPSQMRMRRSLTWIWEPIARDGESRASWIIGRAAALIQDTDDPQLAIASPEVRISTALCTLDSSPLASEIPDNEATRELLEMANRCSRGAEYEIHAGRVVGVAPDVTARISPRDARPASRPLFSRKFAIPTYGDLAGNVLESAIDFPWEGEYSPTIRNPNEFVDLLMDQLEQDHPVWVEILKGIPGSFRATVLRQLYSGGYSSGNVGPSNWAAAFTNVPFQFERSMFYAAILLGMALLTAGAITQGAILIISAPSLISLQSLGVAALCLSFIWSWLWVLAESGSSAIAEIEPEALLIALFGPLTVPVIAVEELRSPPHNLGDVLILSPALVFSPGILFLCALALMSLFTVSTTIIILVAVLTIGIILSVVGTRREVALRTPLAGLFAAPNLLSAASADG